MIHIAFPNVENVDRQRLEALTYRGCVRYLSLPPEQAPDLGRYAPARPPLPVATIQQAARVLVPPGHDPVWTREIYEIRDHGGAIWQGESAGLAYLLALIRGVWPLQVEPWSAGDLWCTGRIDFQGGPVLDSLTQYDGFTAKLHGFIEHPQDRLFLVPAANVFYEQYQLCQVHQVQVLRLEQDGAYTRMRVQAALATGAKVMVPVDRDELPLLIATLFSPPAPPDTHRSLPRQPYKALAAFERHDAALFFGREQEIAALSTMLRDPQVRLVVLHGASGTGKTSLLQAGVLPALPANEYVVVGIPSQEDEPGEAIKQALMEEWACDRSYAQLPLHEFLAAATAALGKTVVVVLDQFEGFFLHHDLQVRRRFHRDLTACVAARHVPIRFVLAIRDDYFVRLAEFQETLPTLFAHTAAVTRLSPAQALAAVMGPAELLQLPINQTNIQERVLPQLLGTDGQIEPPILQIVCHALYEQAQAAGGLAIGDTAATDLGDVSAMLTRYLETAVQQHFGAATDQAWAREILKALVTSEGTKHALDEETLLARLHTIGLPLSAEALQLLFLHRLLRARLVRTYEKDLAPRYELIHDILAPPITAWVQEKERERTQLLEMIARAEELHRLTGELLSPPAVRRIARWQQHNVPLVFPAAQQAFLQASQRAVHRRFWRSVGRAAVLGLLLLGSGLWYWDAYQRAHVDYYAQVITRWGLPEGVGRLSAAQVRQRNTSLAFRKHGRRGPVHDIRLVNSRGTYHPESFHIGIHPLLLFNPLPQEVSGVMPVSRVGFERDAQGQILNQIAYTRTDRRIYTLHYVHPTMAEYKDEGITYPVRESGIALLKVVRPEHGPEAGLEQEVRYFDSAGKLQPDRDGTYGFRYRFDARGLRVEEIPLGADGQPAVTKEGIATNMYTYDALGNLTQIAYFGRDGHALLDKDGAASIKIAYTPSGNLQEIAFMGPDGQLVTRARSGAAGRSFRYDAHGNAVESSFFDLHRQPVMGRLGGKTTAAFARQTVEWDAHGRSLETYFGPDGTPIVLRGHVVKSRGVWDARGYLVERASFDEHGRPIRDLDGCAQERFTHDAHGNEVEQTCLDEREQPIRSTYGYAQVKWVHDARGNAIEEHYFDPTGQPALYDQPYVKERRQYNPQGKQVEEAYFDATDQLVNNKAGYAKVTYTYNLQGHLTETAFFNAQHQPTVRQGNYAKILHRYDEYDRLIEKTLYDPQGHPIRSDDGYATARFAYDSRGYQSETAYFDEDNRSTLNTDGYTKDRIQNNAKGQSVERAYIGLDGAYVLHKDGNAKARLTYNARGQIAERAYFDAQDRLVQLVYGYATKRYAYDELGRETSPIFFDVHGDLVHTRVVLEKVEPDHTGAQHGLQARDILVSYDGEDIRDIRTFRELERMKGERQRELRLLRQDRDIRLTVPPGRLTGLKLEDRTPPALTKVGLSVEGAGLTPP